MATTTVSTNNPSTSEYLSVSMLAAMSSESEFVWRKRVFYRQIPFVKFGRNVRVRRDDFEAWVAARLIAAAAGRPLQQKPNPQADAPRPEGQA